jgi:hypothetical protein
VHLILGGHSNLGPFSHRLNFESLPYQILLILAMISPSAASSSTTAGFSSMAAIPLFSCYDHALEAFWDL